VADLVVVGIAEERFLILTPDANLRPVAARADDYDGWLDSLVRF